MRHETHFNFDGQWSYDKGIIKATVNGGLFEDQIVSSKKIIEEKIEGRIRPYFYGVERDPLSFTLPIYFDDNLSADKIREILRWLDHDNYRPFYMVDHPERITYAMIVNDVNSIHNGIKSGYMELEMRTDSPFTLMPNTFSKVYTFINNENGKQIEFENRGDFNCKPIVHITKRGDGDIIINNLSNNENEFRFTDLKDKEKIKVDCENKEITTSLPNTYRYDDFSKSYLSFVRGINTLKITGDFDLQFETEFGIY